MQKNISLFLFLLAALIVPALCQASITVRKISENITELKFQSCPTTQKI